MIKFKLYSNQYPDGYLLAQCSDGSAAYILKNHYRETYSKSDYMVTIKYPRKQEEIITDCINEFKDKHFDIFSKWCRGDDTMTT